MSFLTLPTDPLSYTITGDIDVLNGITSTNGDGTIYVRNGGLYVNGLSDLNQTTIDTTAGIFNVLGTNNVVYNVTAAVQITAAAASFFNTTVGTLGFNASNSTTGKVNIVAAGSGTNSVLIDATNIINGQVTLQSAGASTSVTPVRILATDTTNGSILIQGSGNFAASNPAISLLASNATSGKILLSSSGDSASVDAIELLAAGTTGGNISLSAAGVNTTSPAINILATNAVSGQVIVRSDGAIPAAVRIFASEATAGGIDIDAVGGAIAIDTQNTATGVTIATVTSGVPVTIGTTASVTTIVGDLVVNGTRTIINTEVLTVEDNFILINSGNGELGCDAGVVVKRFQTPNNLGTGDVVNSLNPVQESGAFQAGSATPGTLVLAAFASSSTDFYKGWWIKVTSGTGNNQVRRIKSYNGTTKTATLYVTADNTTSPEVFSDGLNLVNAPAAADTYRLYSWVHVASYYDTSMNTFNIATLANDPDAISGGGISTAVVQQYQDIASGAHSVRTKIYDNVRGSASTTTITLTLIGHGQAVNDIVRTSNPTGYTPAIPNNIYYIASVIDANTFTITVPASTTATTAASVTLEMYSTSIIYANIIEPYNPDYPFSISGVSSIIDIIIPRTSTSAFPLTGVSLAQGAYIILVGDLNNVDGAFAVFAACSSGSGGSVSRLVSSRGAQSQRLQMNYDSASILELKQAPAGSGGGNYTYRCRISSAI